MLTYDVFDARGHFTRQVSVVGPGEVEGNLLRFYDGDRAVLISGLRDANLAMQGLSTENEEAEPLAVVSYMVER
jgi:hypothetical protein